VARPGHDLIADSRLAWSIKTFLNVPKTYPLTCAVDIQVTVTADGTVVCGANGVFRVVKQRTPGRIRTLYQVIVETPTPEGASIAVLWAGPSGDTVIVDWGVARDTEPPGNLGLASHGTFTPLPSVPSFLFVPGPAW
jgi:hypothetical protein